MSVIERNISYFFPTSPQSRQEAIEKNRKFGRQWVSTSLQQGGFERMKFCVLSYTDSLGYTYLNGKRISRKDKKPLLGYSGRDTKGRREWDT